MPSLGRWPGPGRVKGLEEEEEEEGEEEEGGRGTTLGARRGRGGGGGCCGVSRPLPACNCRRCSWKRELIAVAWTRAAAAGAAQQIAALIAPGRANHTEKPHELSGARPSATTRRCQLWELTAPIVPCLSLLFALESVCSAVLCSASGPFRCAGAVLAHSQRLDACWWF